MNLDRKIPNLIVRSLMSVYTVPLDFRVKIKIKNEPYTSKHALYDGIGLRISKHNLPCVFVISK